MPLCAAIKEEKYKLTIIPVDFPRGKSTPGVLLCTVQKNSRMESKYNLEKFHEGEAGSRASKWLSDCGVTSDMSWVTIANPHRVER
jgi:hypothetical protein